jgi:protein-tyrosine phosphatase
MEWIDNYVAVGSYRDAVGVKGLLDQGIDLIIDARTLFDDTHGRSDRVPRPEKVKDAVDLILANEAMGAKILIRCHHGRDRAPFVAMAYVARKYELSFEDAYALVKERRPRTVFHWDWVRILENYMNSLQENPKTGK